MNTMKREVYPKGLPLPVLQTKRQARLQREAQAAMDREARAEQSFECVVNVKGNRVRIVTQGTLGIPRVFKTGTTQSLTSAMAEMLASRILYALDAASRQGAAQRVAQADTASRLTWVWRRRHGR